MDKTEIDSILVANWYFTSCKLSVENSHNCEKTQLAKKYLVNKIKKALIDKSVKTKSIKAFSVFKVFPLTKLIF